MKPIRRSQRVAEKFAAMGIQHVSPSSLDSWISERAKWYLRYIAKYKDVSPVMWRGTAVEKGLYYAMLHQSAPVEDVVAYALDCYDAEVMKDTHLLSKENTEKVPEQKDVVKAIVHCCAPQIRELGVPITNQIRVEGDLGIEIPLLGFADIDMGDFLLEVKSTQRMPSDFASATESHKRQASLYSHEIKKPVKLVYAGVEPKNKAHSGFKVFDIPADSVLNYVRQYHLAARSLRRAVMMTETVEDLAELCVPNFDAFQWDAESEAIARKIWSIEEAA
jgi:hypothetical protein